LMATGILLSLVILAMPLLSALVIAALRRQLGTKAHLVGIGTMGVSLALAVVLAIGHEQFAGQHEDWNWFEIAGKSLQVGITLDGLTLAMLVVVTLVSFLVHLFSK